MNTEELEQNLASLARSLPDDHNFVPAVLSRLAAESIKPTVSTYKRWIMRSSLGLAASVLIALAVWSSFLSAPRPAYAVEDITQRMLALDSIHIKGVMFPSNSAPGQPIEIYVQQPDKIRVNGHVDDSGPNGVKVTDLIITARQSITIDPATKTAVITPENPEEARTLVAQQLQGELQTLVGAPNSLKKLRTDHLDGASVDVYGSSIYTGMRYEVWFNPATGLPVRTLLYVPGDNQAERLAMRWDTIEANPKIPDDIFVPSFPGGWTINYPSAPHPADIPLTGGQFGDIHIDHRYLISLNNGDLLLCWSMFDSTDPAHDLALASKGVTITIKSQNGIAYTERLLRADPRSTIGCHWRWSRLHPQSPEPTPQILLSFSAADRNHNDNTNTSIPITYRADELDERIQALQRLTLPPGQSPLTLQQIKDQAAK